MMEKRIKKTPDNSDRFKTYCFNVHCSIKQSALVRFQQRDTSVVLVFLKLYVQDISWCCQTLI